MIKEKMTPLDEKKINWAKWDNKLRDDYYKPKDVKEAVQGLIIEIEHDLYTTSYQKLAIIGSIIKHFGRGLTDEI